MSSKYRIVQSAHPSATANDIFEWNDASPEEKLGHTFFVGSMPSANPKRENQHRSGRTPRANTG